MRLLLISVLAIFLVVLLTPNAFGMTQLVMIPYGSGTMKSMNYDPNQIEIQKGDTVKWANLDRNTAHTVTSTIWVGYPIPQKQPGYSGLFDSGELLPNNDSNDCYPNCKPSFSYTFDAGGTYTYECKIHSWLKGVVKVIELGQDAEIQIHGDAGDMYIDKSVNVVGAAPIGIKIYGNVKNPRADDKVIFSITDPNGDTESQTTYIKQNGEYQLVISVNHDDVGTYSATATFAGDNIGTTSFSVVKRSIPEELILKQDHESLGLTEIERRGILTVNTDLSSYKSGDTIRISGITPYLGANQQNNSQVTIQVINPQNNIVTVSQVSTRDDGTYSTSINSEGPLFRVGGAYTIKVNYTTEQISTKFFLDLITNPQSPIESPNTRTATFLKLDSLDNTFTVENIDSRSSMTFSGQLLKIDRQSTIPGAAIKLAFTGFSYDGNDHYKITTDNNGKFDWGVTMPIGKGYAVQAVYDGSLNYKSSKSQTEYFDVVSQSLAPADDDFWLGMITVLVFLLVIITVLVVAIIAIKNRKKKIQPPPTIPSGGGTPGGGTPGGGTPGGGTPGGGTPGGGTPGRRRAQAGAKVISRAVGGSQIWKLIGKPPIVPGGLKKAVKKAVKKKSKMRDPKYQLRCKICGNENLIDGMDGLQTCSKQTCGWRNQ